MIVAHARGAAFPQGAVTGNEAQGGAGRRTAEKEQEVVAGVGIDTATVTIGTVRGTTGGARRAVEGKIVVQTVQE